MRFSDLSGQRFGRLVVLERLDDIVQENGRKRSLYRCKCDCGNEKNVRGENLTGGITQSCGCLNKERTSAASIKDLTGQRIGKLVVLKRANEIGDGKVRWLCKCDCGTTKSILADALNDGSTTSCGCRRRSAIGERTLKHGHRHERIYSIYCDIKRRCYNEKRTGYANYGARGIRMCDDWKNDFMTFFNWAMANGYEEHLTIDRIDNDGNYEPGNCRWITKSENSTKRNIEYWRKRHESKVG